MKKSHLVGLTLLGVWAAALAKCGGNRECIDQNNVVVDNRNCTQPSGGGGHWFYTYSSPGSVGTTVDASTGTTRGVFGGAGDAAGHGGDGAGE